MERNNDGMHQACASCKHQRKKCNEYCILAPYFPAEKSQEFLLVHKVYGVSNVTKMIRTLKPEEQKMAADSLVWDATWRMKNPVLGSFGEFKKIYEERNRLYEQVKFYEHILGQNGTMMIKPDLSLMGRNNNVTNPSYDKGSNAIDFDVENLKSLDQESDFGQVFGLGQQQHQHSVNGFNQYYFSGPLSRINDKTMENSECED